MTLLHLIGFTGFSYYWKSLREVLWLTKRKVHRTVLRLDPFLVDFTGFYGRFPCFSAMLVLGPMT